MPAPWESLLARAEAAFADRFGGEPAVMGWAPGRVELLGNHTDYNGGLVIAAAIDRSTVVAGRRLEGREARFESVQLRRGRCILARRDRAHRDRDMGPIHARRLLGAVGVGRAARVGLRGRHRRRRPARRGAVQLGEPPGVGRLVPDPARAGAGPSTPGVHPGRRRPAPHGTGHDAPALGERVRRGRLGPARPVLQPVRPGRPCAVPRLRARWSTTACRWATLPRRSSCATRRPRAGWPTGCTISAGPSASASWTSFRRPHAPSR